jgi:serine/threonine protein phosphatase PrpC
MNITLETKGMASVTWGKGTKHKFYEDRYRILSKDIPLVGEQDRGELFAVFDGIGSAPKGRQAAQEMADILLNFFLRAESHELSLEGVEKLLLQGNESIHQWGFMEGTDVPQGGCAGTVAWLYHENLSLFHAGDTSAVLIQNRGNTLKLTRDHQAENGAIYRYFGLGPILQLEKASLQVEELDRILLLTDGVIKVIHPLEAAESIKRHDDIGRAAKTLAQQAFQKGSIDDITVLVIEIE